MLATSSNEVQGFNDAASVIAMVGGGGGARAFFRRGVLEFGKFGVLYAIDGLYMLELQKYTIYLSKRIKIRAKLVLITDSPVPFILIFVLGRRLFPVRPKRVGRYETPAIKKDK